MLRGSSWFGSLRDRFVARMKQYASDVSAADWVWSAEMCGQSYVAHPPVARVHFHVAMILRPDARSDEAERGFLGSEPVLSACNRWAAVSSRVRAFQRMMFYVQAPKIGQIVSSGTVQPFVDYCVQPDQILTLVQASKGHA